jgi:hypothetical protein
VKLVSIICSILSAILLWRLVLNAIGPRGAAFVVAVFVTLPMELHYGDLVDYEPCLVMWMLAALNCIRNWDLHRAPRWAALAALCCLGAVSTDWPGYLFTAAVSLWLLLKKDEQSRNLAILFVGLAIFAASLFLFQIRHVNPEGWDDLWTAITMRLGNGTQAGSSPNVAGGATHFGFADWLQRILQSLDQNYLRTTWVLMIGGGFYLYRHRKSAGARWLALAALFMAAAGIPYLVILRNWSFIHDFASIFVIGAIAILGGLGLEVLWEWIEVRSWTKGPRRIAAIAIFLFLGTLAWTGFVRAEENRSQFQILDDEASEPANLIRDLGRYLATVFPEDTTILCNFDPYYSPLSYYADRNIVRNLTTAAEWDFAMKDQEETFGGIVWLEAPLADEIIATLPVSERSNVKIDGVPFAIWRRASNASTATR